MLKIWGRASSSNVQALMWCVGELGLVHERFDAGFVYGVVDQPFFRAMNPNGTVPTLIDGDHPPLWETGAILRYLASVYASDDFWPQNPVRRAEVDKWAEWAKVNIALNFTAPIFWRVVRTPAAERDPGAVAVALDRLVKFLRIAEGQLQVTEFLAGDCLTLADIQFGHCLYRYYDIDLARPNLPGLRRYFDRLASRPAFQRHVMISYDELRDRPG